MDKLNFVRDGATRMPPGFRFQPTDEELVFQYLKCKVFSCPLPASIIPEINVCKYDPWDLPGNPQQERYFFCYKEAKYRNGNRMNRTTSSGYWKTAGSDKRVSSSGRSDIAGIRKTLVFYQGKSPNGSRTDWIMHEYHLVTAATTSNSNSTQIFANQIGDWVLCRVFSKKRGLENEERVTNSRHRRKTVMNGEERVAHEPRFFDFMMVNEAISQLGPAPSCVSSSSSSSSSVKESYSTLSNFEEGNGYNDF